MDRAEQLRIRKEIHEEVVRSRKPYPTNVSTPIGQQSEEYKKAKRMANERRRKRAEVREARNA